ncbi:hypothetical protein BGW38_010609 [Lunasporangiospora selenospora]|uniref:DDE Tnp4 domain-containing protein n=1 Tax=Lunasporangiospora selenospora TaxID=979761 RepID=A0A9P6FW21_9FUNG|nr:hypothetical protein BGW38_010609 [Lunasporangiospora selenospora]
MCSPTAEDMIFNIYHGRARASVENAFGILKNRSQSLKNLPVKINKMQHVGKAARWIIAPVCIHNFSRLYIE